MVSRGFHGMVDSRQLDCPKVSTMSPHTCQLCPRSKHKATKKRSKENAFRTRAHKLTQRAVSAFLAPQKHGARQNHRCVNPSFSEHGYPHASPPVTEPAKGSPRAIRGQTTHRICTHIEPRRQPSSKRGRTMVRPCELFGNGACPRAYGAKRVRVRIREKEGFTHPSLWRAPCFWGAKNAEIAR